MSENNFNVNHVAIIMDGNGRWAQSRGLERTEGHKAGADNVLHIIQACQDFGIKYLTLYAFSTENWKRPADEVSALMSLLQKFLTLHLEKLQKYNIRLNVLGRISELPIAARMKLESAIKATAGNNGAVLTLALNYGGRAEIVDAAKKFAEAVKAGKIDPAKLDEQAFSRFLYDPELPDPELVIRTSGELRISNFLIWEMAYSEIYVTDVFWPDFNKSEFKKALESFGGRKRRFGGLDKK